MSEALGRPENSDARVGSYEFWTFAMSCCISSAVCCLMVTGSMSGIALGYNYSLAEYIDLKETNVSVYLKRGVFDDTITDDTLDSMRRSGRGGDADNSGSDNQRSAEEDRTPLGSGRRLEDSVFESDDPNKYEGSLMKLTATPLVPYPGTTEGTTVIPEYVQLKPKYEQGSLDQLKAIQAMISARKSTMDMKSPQKTTYADVDERFIAQLPPNPNQQPQGRRMMGGPNIDDRLNPARLAVPPQSIGSIGNWKFPKDPERYRKRFSYSDIDYPNFKPEYPKPIRLQTGPRRPPTPTPTPEMRTYSIENENEEMAKPRMTLMPIVKPDLDSALKKFREKMILEKFEAPVNDYPKKSADPSDPSYDYEEEVKGLPVRRRRSIEENILSVNGEIFIEKGITEDYTANNNSDSTVPPFKITNHNDTFNGNINHKDVLPKKGDSKVFYKSPQTKLRQDTIEEMRIIKLVHDGIKITTMADSLKNKLLVKLISKESEDRSSKETENVANSREYTLNEIWYGFTGKPGKEDGKINGDVESENTITNAVKTLSTNGISVNDIKPSIMVGIF